MQPFEEFAEKSFGSLCVASALYQDIQHVVMLIDRSPQKVFLSSDRQNDLVQMPFVATRRTTTTQFISIGLPECASTIVAPSHTSPQRLAGPKLFDITKTEVEKRK